MEKQTKRETVNGNLKQKSSSVSSNEKGAVTLGCPPEPLLSGSSFRDTSSALAKMSACETTIVDCAQAATEEGVSTIFRGLPQPP